MSQSTSRVEVDDELLERVHEYAAQLPEDFVTVPKQYADMPYRQLLWLMDARLARKGRADEHGYGPPEEFRADLELIAASDDADVQALKGWRRELFGEDALALKNGRLALTVSGQELKATPVSG